MVVDVLEEVAVGFELAAAGEDRVAQFRHGVGVDFHSCVEEAFAGDFAEGGGLHEFGEDEGADVVEADVHFAEEFARAFHVDFVRLVARVVAVAVEEFVHVRSNGVVGVVGWVGEEARGVKC